MILLLMIYLSIFVAAVVGSVVVVIVFPLFGATKDKTRDSKDLVRTSLRVIRYFCKTVRESSRQYKQASCS